MSMTPRSEREIEEDDSNEFTLRSQSDYGKRSSVFNKKLAGTKASRNMQFDNSSQKNNSHEYEGGEDDLDIFTPHSEDIGGPPPESTLRPVFTTTGKLRINTDVV